MSPLSERARTACRSPRTSGRTASTFASSAVRCRPGPRACPRACGSSPRALRLPSTIRSRHLRLPRTAGAKDCPTPTSAFRCRSRRSFPTDSRSRKRCVPELQANLVAALQRTANGFQLCIEGGEVVSAREVVIAVGLTYYDFVPPILSSLPRGIGESQFGTQNCRQLHRPRGRGGGRGGVGPRPCRRTSRIGRAGRDYLPTTFRPHP